MIRFTESQQFWNWLRYGIVLFNSFIVYFAIQSGEMPIHFIFILLILLAPLLLFFWTLQTELDSSHIFIKIKPFVNKSIAYESIKNWTIRSYKPLREFGGWGIRWGPRGVAYNTTGNIGLQLTLHTGKKILIGTQKPDELNRVLRTIIPNKES